MSGSAVGPLTMSELYLFAGGVAAFVASLLAAYFRGGKNATAKINDKIAKGTIARKDTRDEIDDDVRLVDAADELRDKWSLPKS